MYPPYMRELIKKVDETRPKRKGIEFDRMTPKQREDVLRNFHPDYVEESFEEIPLGKNKGDRAPRELVKLLKKPSRIDVSNINLDEPDYNVDVLIIGGGGAGAAAALSARSEGASVLLATKLRLGDCNTMMAQGGIQAATLPHDSPSIHYLDAMGGGHFTNLPELVYTLVHDGPGIIKWLEDLGVNFDKKEDGTLKPNHGGGTSRKRMHAARDYTGADIMRVLRDEVYNKEISVFEFCPAMDIILDDKGSASGAVLYDVETNRYVVVKAKTVILASGGSGRLHFQGFPTTNHYGATGDALVMAYRAGAGLKYMDTIQYHPTGAAFPPQILGQLVTEKLRGMGATPVNIEGELFVHHLEPRDVEAAAIIRECSEKGKGIKTPTGLDGVWLDTPLLEAIHGEGTLLNNFPAMVRQFGRFEIDMRKEPILIYPTLHYQNGGIEIDEKCETNVGNLFAAGENSGGVHGRNRLAGNSLLDVMVFGRRAGLNAAGKLEDIEEVKSEKLTLEHLDNHKKELQQVGIDAILEENEDSPLLFPDYLSKAENS
ncbi:FAD-dependent oxidoreductase [Natranaerofaba carboxydovora]|uniref:FAD-dependent oxidoreductase n=1 Tax=Natranaerofaba carboxydovora TaxID=2742683 RepID=UPI001F1491B1|nr:FAD-dependent oxidoreductase [Natranaerofaba carboxydovora]UMZ74180.1 Fumarate reductase flavoprotein subunit [Natranaerofaba carboxydovora]